LSMRARGAGWGGASLVPGVDRLDSGRSVVLLCEHLLE
jgi:hypothetical protein